MKILGGKIELTHIFVILAFVENSPWICIGVANKSHDKNPAIWTFDDWYRSPFWLSRA
jgi:peptidoglycan/xylan/chitin deacetylase (PgdA/CDA1 family)